MKIKFGRIKKFLEKFLLSIVKHDFLTSLFLFLLSLVFGGILFYKYCILTKRAEPEALEQSFLIKKEVYQDVLKVWQENEKKIQEADFKEYPDPFRKSTTATGEAQR